ncbi:Protein required for ethanol metabolism, variant 2 [Mucor circinelloides]
MMTLGDIICQQVIEKKGLENHDVGRSVRIMIYAGTINGPLVGSWFGFINNAVKIQNKWAATFVRVGIDQAVFSPAILAMFMGGISILEGRTLNEIKMKFENSYFNGLMNAYCYWPFVNIFTFSMIPIHYRPIVNSCFGVAWNSYLSHMNQKSLQSLKLVNSDNTQHTSSTAISTATSALPSSPSST